MNLLDIRTTLIGGVISDAICTLVISFICLKAVRSKANAHYH
jgi:hypothetical protein